MQSIQETSNSKEAKGIILEKNSWAVDSGPNYTWGFRRNNVDYVQVACFSQPAVDQINITENIIIRIPFPQEPTLST